MLSSPFRQNKWLATKTIEGTLGRLLLKYIPTDAKNGIVNYYSLVTNVAFPLQCFSKMRLEKSASQIFASVTGFQITFLPFRRERAARKPCVPGGEGKPFSQEIVGWLLGVKSRWN